MSLQSRLGNKWLERVLGIFNISEKRKTNAFIVFCKMNVKISVKNPHVYCCKFNDFASVVQSLGAILPGVEPNVGILQLRASTPSVVWAEVQAQGPVFALPAASLRSSS